MTDNSVPAYDELMQPLLDELKIFGRSVSVAELNQQIAATLGLSQSQINQRHQPDSPSPTRFAYNLGWTRTYLKRAGYIANPKHGIWEITELGRTTKVLDIDRVKRDVQTYKVKNGPAVTVPDPQDEIDDTEEIVELVPANEEAVAVSDHVRVQWLLLKLGQDMGLSVWIASNDQGKHYQGNYFKNQPALLSTLPVQFDQATQRTIELIDVLWLQDDAILAAFEIENTSSIYSGLLRMSDLVAMHSNITFPLYIVAPDERQKKVMLEINRPTFSKAIKLTRRCGYISYTKLGEAIAWVKGHERHVSPNFINNYSEQVTSDT